MPKKLKTYIIHIGLFLITFVTTTIAGTEHSVSPFVALDFEKGFQWNYAWTDLQRGLWFSIPFLLVLTVHEFGHYFLAKYHQVKTSLPYYIPLWIPTSFPIPGTMGAIIRIRELIFSKKQYFDIGIAGPLAGWVMAMAFLFYGFTHLPEREHILSIHPEYQPFLEQNKEGDKYIEEYMNSQKPMVQQLYKKELNQEIALNEIKIPVLKIGKNLTFWFFENYVVDDKSKIPSSYEIYHYPILYAGFLSLFFTFLNLLPIGQLDGGHILYGLIGFKNHKIASLIIFTLFIGYAGVGLELNDWIVPYSGDNTSLWINSLLYAGFLYFLYNRFVEQQSTAIVIALAITTFHLAMFLYFPMIKGYNSWLFFAFILSRVIGIYHPQAFDESPLDMKRKVLGWFTLFIFVISFTPQPFDLVNL